MQHAHRAHQPARPCGSRYLQHKWDKSDFERHREKVKAAKATISTSPPRRYGHLEVKLKKLQLEEERASRMERDDRVLHEKISRISQRTAGRGFELGDDRGGRSLCREKRRRELLQVARENRALLERLSRCGSRYSVARWHEDWLRSSAYGDSIARYPRAAPPEKVPCRGSKAAETAKEREGEKEGHFHSPKRQGDKDESGVTVRVTRRDKAAARSVQ